MKTNKIKTVNKARSKRKPSTRKNKRISKKIRHTPELNLMHWFLHSINQVAPSDWMPTQYRIRMNQKMQRPVLH